jgi:hypothetical protein
MSGADSGGVFAAEVVSDDFEFVAERVTFSFEDESKFSAGLAFAAVLRVMSCGGTEVAGTV